MMIHIFAWSVTIVAVLFVSALVIGNFMYSAPAYRGPVSDHFDGRHFYNKTPAEHRSFFRLLKWMITRERGKWLPYSDLPYGHPPPMEVADGKIRVTFVNHSTVLIQLDGLNILTDPVWSFRIGPLSWLGLTRHISPGIRMEDLPPIDIILISHNHYDHLDIPTLKILTRKHNAQIYNALGNSALLSKYQIKPSRGMDWWEEAKLENGVSITFVPSRHFSIRSMWDRNRTLWGGFVIQGPSGIVYFASDSGMGPHFEEIKKRFGEPRLAILPIGAYLPQWFMSPMHLSPENAVEVHKLLGAGTTLAVHYGTFELGDDGQFEAVERIQKILREKPGMEKEFWLLMPGEGRDVP